MDWVDILRRYAVEGCTVEVTLSTELGEKRRRARFLRAEGNEDKVLLDFDDVIDLVHGSHIRDVRIFKSPALQGNAPTAPGDAPAIVAADPPPSSPLLAPQASTPAHWTGRPVSQTHAFETFFTDPPILPPGEPCFTIDGLNKDDQATVVRSKNRYEYALKVKELARIREDLPPLQRLAEALRRADLFALAGHLALKINDAARGRTLLDAAGSLGHTPSLLSAASIAINGQRFEDATDHLIRALAPPSALKGSVDHFVALGRCVFRCPSREREGLGSVAEGALDDRAQSAAWALLAFALSGRPEAAEAARAGNMKGARELAPDSPIFRPPAALQSALLVPRVILALPSSRRPTTAEQGGITPPQAERSRASREVRLQGLPRNASAYAKAKRAEQLDDLDAAQRLFEQEVQTQGDYRLSAIKDLASLLARRDRIDEALKLLDTHRRAFTETRSVDNIRANLLVKGQRFLEAAELFQSLQKGINSPGRDNLVRQQASCLSMAGRHDQALTILEPRSRRKPGNPALRGLIDRIRQAKEVSRTVPGSIPPSTPVIGQRSPESVGEPTTEGTAPLTRVVDEELLQLVGLSDTISPFAKLVMQRCEMRGLDEKAKARGFYDEQDFTKVDRQIEQVRGSRPRERADLWLTLARMQQESPNAAGDRSIRHSLARSFRYHGEAAILDDRPRDVPRCYLTESLLLSSPFSASAATETTAANLMATYLTQTPRPGEGTGKLETVVQRFHGDERGWRAFLRDYPYYAALSPAFVSVIPRGQTARLSGSAVMLPGGADLEAKRQKEATRIREEEASLQAMTRTKLTSAGTNHNQTTLDTLARMTPFDLDRERMARLSALFGDAARYCLEHDYVEREGQHSRLHLNLDKLAQEVDAAPTKLSIEMLRTIVQKLRDDLDENFGEFEAAAQPKIDVTNVLANDYSPMDSEGVVALPIEVSSQPGGAPVEDLRLAPIEENGLTCIEPGLLAESLRGGERREIRARVRPSRQQVEDRAFTLRIEVQYRNRSGQRAVAGPFSLPVRLGESEPFEPIPNPYEHYAGGGEVDNPDMFFGRQELVTKILRQVTDGEVGQCFVLYGQKRTGKSSVLVQVLKRIKPPSLAVKLTLGALDTSHAEGSFIRMCVDRMEERIADGLGLPLDGWPSNADLATDSMASFQRALRSALHALRAAGWVEPRIVLLVDEFTYVYEYIKEGIVSPLFMRQWKGLLESRIFSAVVAGQDSMPKFKQQYANEFGRTFDERLDYLSTEEARSLADRPMLLAGRSRYRGKAIESLLRLTAGNPFFLQIVCDRLVRHLNDRRAAFVTEADIETAMRSLIAGREVLGIERFDSLITMAGESVAEATRERYLELLTHVARASSPTSGAPLSEIPEAPDRACLLQDMRERHIIDYDAAERISIRVGLFAEWLRRNLVPTICRGSQA